MRTVLKSKSWRWDFLPWNLKIDKDISTVLEIHTHTHTYLYETFKVWVKRKEGKQRVEVVARQVVIIIIATTTNIIIIITTRPKPAYGREGLANILTSSSTSLGQSRPSRIVGPRYRSSRFLLGCSQRLTSRLWRSAWLLIQNYYVTNRAIQLTSFGPKTLRHYPWFPLDVPLIY